MVVYDYMAKLIPLPPKLFKKLSSDERIQMKLMLYKQEVQEMIVGIREHYALCPLKPLPKRAEKNVAKYACDLITSENWARDVTFVQQKFMINAKVFKSKWQPILCLFIKHNIIAPPSLFSEMIYEDAFASLENDMQDRLRWAYLTSHYHLDVNAKTGFQENGKMVTVQEQQLNLASELCERAKKSKKKEDFLLMIVSFHSRSELSTKTLT